MVAEGAPQYGSPWAAIYAVAGQAWGRCPRDRAHVGRRAEVSAGHRPDVTGEQIEEITRLKRENAERRRANETLKAASAFFAAGCDRPAKR